MKLLEITQFLDRLLALDQFRDASNNGLQIENGGEVTHVAFGVDASLRTFRAAAEAGADLLICHHGLSWGDSLKRITGLNYSLVSYAIRHGLAVYGAHLPLDAHPVYGNNAQLCELLDLENKRPAFDYHGNLIGFMAETRQPVAREAFAQRVRERVAPFLKTVFFGAERVQKIGVVSGGACEMVDQAVCEGADLFLTGEPGLVGYTLAENLGTNMICAGHYATETWGVRALKKVIEKRFAVKTTEFDFKIEF